MANLAKFIKFQGLILEDFNFDYLLKDLNLLVQKVFIYDPQNFEIPALFTLKDKKTTNFIGEIPSRFLNFIKD